MQEMSDLKRLVVVSGITLALLALLFVIVLHAVIDFELKVVCAKGQRGPIVGRCDDWAENIERHYRREMYECFFIDRPNGSIDTIECLKDKGLSPPDR